jgi:uncharacterized caspase-like protein
MYSLIDSIIIFKIILIQCHCFVPENIKMKQLLFILLSLLMVDSLSYAAQPAKKKQQANTSVTTTTQTYTSVAGEKRVALVIGNSTYPNFPLKNPANDAKDMATKLRVLGFDVIERNNLKTKQIGSTLSEFRNKLSPGSVALVFYAGHGLQIKGENYLPAVDADITVEEDVSNQSLSVRQIMDVLDNAKSRLNLVFLDACRNNPFANRSFRSTEGGLARVSAPSGTLISYATRPGSVAADGDGRNGLYTSKLLAQMDSNQQIEQSLKRVVSEVKSASQGKQEPWMEGSIEGDFCFGGCNTGASTQVATLTPEATSESATTAATIKTKEQIEDEYWEEIKDSGDITSLEQYRKDYPKGRYLNTAKIKIAQLKKQGKEPTTNTTSTTTSASQEGESALWTEVQSSNSKEDYEAYLTQYPKGKYVVLAKSRMKKLDDEAAKQVAQEEQASWEMANSSATKESYVSYLNSYPNGRYTSLATVRLEKIKKQASQAQATTLSSTTALTNNNQVNNSSTLYIYGGSASGWQIFNKGAPIGIVYDGAYVKYDVSDGKVNLTTDCRGSESVVFNADLEPKKTYFVKFHTGLFSCSFSLESEKNGVEAIKGLKISRY